MIALKKAIAAIAAVAVRAENEVKRMPRGEFRRAANYIKFFLQVVHVLRRFFERFYKVISRITSQRIERRNRYDGYLKIFRLLFLFTHYLQFLVREQFFVTPFLADLRFSVTFLIKLFAERIEFFVRDFLFGKRCNRRSLTANVKDG